MVPAGDCSVPLGAPVAEAKLDQNVPLRTQVSVTFPAELTHSCLLTEEIYLEDCV